MANNNNLKHLLEEVKKQEDVEMSKLEAKRNKWKDSAFYYIPQLASATRGKIGKNCIRQQLERKKLKVTPSSDNGHDFIVNGVKTVIKFSALWNKGFYKFQQIKKPKNSWDLLVCFGVSPTSEAHLWFSTRSIFTCIEGQHTGIYSNETKWFGIYPPNTLVPTKHKMSEKLRRCLKGGSFDKAVDELAKEIRRLSR